MEKNVSEEADNILLFPQSDKGDNGKFIISFQFTAQ